MSNLDGLDEIEIPEYKDPQSGTMIIIEYHDESKDYSAHYNGNTIKGVGLHPESALKALIRVKPVIT